MTVNLLILGFFKYFNFFVDSAAAILQSLGIQANLPTLRIVLPVGLSFYTFQSMSYTLDVYRGKFAPTRDLTGFLAFVSFFPQMVAGPIERAGHMLPQFLNPRHFNSSLARDGLRQILWGLFKKMVVANNLAGSVDVVFSSPETMTTGTLWLGAFFFAIQIYCDFSGYSDMALGLARLFGFDLTRNFRTPYFALNLPEFWQRWHISLSSWFRDYIFIPLGGSRVNTMQWCFNILITFGASGLWHGANWTFIVWGLIHGMFYLADTATFGRADIWMQQQASRPARIAFHTVRYLFTILVVLAAWVFFRAENMTSAITYLKGMLISAGTDFRTFGAAPRFTLIMLAAEWLARNRTHTLAIADWPRICRWPLYYAIIVYIFKYGNFQYVPFIYFQF